MLDHGLLLHCDCGACDAIWIPGSSSDLLWDPRIASFLSYSQASLIINQEIYVDLMLTVEYILRLEMFHVLLLLSVKVDKVW